MQFLNQSDSKKVKECFGYYMISQEQYSLYFSEENGVKNKVEDEEEKYYRVYEFSLMDEYYKKVNSKIEEVTCSPGTMGSLTYIIVSEDEVDEDNLSNSFKFKLQTTVFNTSSMFALFLSNLDYCSLNSDTDIQ